MGGDSDSDNLVGVMCEWVLGGEGWVRKKSVRARARVRARAELVGKVTGCLGLGLCWLGGVIQLRWIR